MLTYTYVHHKYDRTHTHTPPLPPTHIQNLCVHFRTVRIFTIRSRCPQSWQQYLQLTQSCQFVFFFQKLFPEKKRKTENKETTFRNTNNFHQRLKPISMSCKQINLAGGIWQVIDRARMCSTFDLLGARRFCLGNSCRGIWTTNHRHAFQWRFTWGRWGVLLKNSFGRIMRRWRWWEGCFGEVVIVGKLKALLLLLLTTITITIIAII